MGRKIKISEEQYNKALSEGVTLTADVAAANGDVKKAIETTKQEAQKDGIDLQKTNIQIPGAMANENKIITKKALMENRLKRLKQHSKLYNLSDFLKQ